MSLRRGRGRAAFRQIRSAIEALEGRQLLCAEHLASGPTLTAALTSLSSLTLEGNDEITSPSLTVPTGAVGASGPASASPGQINGGGLWGGGIYGAASTGFTTRADGLPLLNSKTGAPFSVFLDFDGWSGNGYGGAQTWTPYDTDGNSANFSTAEQGNIAEGWRRIASFFAPFDVNVTTQQPANGNNFSWSVISNSGGGYSWLQLGSYAPSAFNPSSDLLGRTSGLLHEIGHNFSLQHQSIYDSTGTKTTEYRGHTDAIHGVVMGVDYDGIPPKWLYGHPATSAVSAQDDVAIIASKIKAYEAAGGDGMRADDYGNTTATAATLPSGTGSVISDGFGVIERLSDADAFKLPTTAGWYTIAVTPDSPSALDSKLEIYDSAGNKLAVVDDPASISSSVTLNLPAGSNYAIVRSHGNYDDLGAYEIKVTTASPVTGPTINAEPAPTNVAAALATGTGITVSWTATATATGYQVERSSDGVNFTSVGTVTSATTSYTDSSLNGSARYVYQVRSKNATGVGPASTQVAILNRPSAVTGLRTTLISSTQVVIDWLETAGSSSETGYRIERGTDGVTFTTAGTVGPNVVLFNNTGLTNASTYFYRVIPTSTLGDGPASAVVSVTTRLPAVTGLAFTTKTPTSLSLSWANLTGNAGYRLERSTDGSTWTALPDLATNTTTYTDTGLSAASEYYYRVSALDSTGLQGTASAVIFTATPASSLPPAPWTSTDIGSPAGAGATSFNTANNTFKIVAEGSDIWGTSDQFRYTYQNWTGDGTITARVVTEENTSAWAKVGVMFRDTTAAGSSQALMSITPGNGAALQWRSATGGSSTNSNTTNINGARPIAPYWVRLTRTGSTFTGYASPDGTTWTQVGTATVTMGSNVLVGLASVSGDVAQLNTSAIDQVTVNVLNVAPVANADSATTIANTAVTVNVLANDTDANNDPLTVQSVSTPAHGTTAIVAGGVKYTPATNYSGSDSFTYVVSDGNGGTATGTVSITVQPSNTPPVAVNDTALTAEDTPVTINVLSNDTDINNDTLTVQSASTPAHGTTAIVAGGIKYTPAVDYNGTDSFTYVVADGKGGTATGTVNVTITPVNDNPVATNDTATTVEDSFAIVDVLANDTDVDGNPLTIQSVGTPTNGTAVIQAGKIRYTPKANFNGTDSFTYVISDGQGGTSTGTVNVTISPVNDPPVAVDDVATVAEDSAPTSIDVLVNDTDVDGDILKVLSVGSPANGTVTVNSGGSGVTYQPNPNFTGTDTFTYVVYDPNGGSDTGKVTITVTKVNDPPVAVPDSATTAEDTAVLINVRSNDTDIDGDPLTISAVGTPGHGTAVIVAGQVRYTPNADYNGPDSFSYTIDDGNGGSSSANVSVVVTAVNDNPVANSDSLNVPTNVATNIKVLYNDTDVDGDVISLTSVTAPAHGTTTANSDGSITYTPSTGYLGGDTFTYVIGDGNGGTATGTVTLQVVTPNGAPTARGDAVSTTPNTAVAVNVLANDTDPNNDLLSVLYVNSPSHGKALLGTGNVITYTPNPDFTGSDSFTYTITDNNGGFSTAIVAVFVGQPNNAPTVATAANASASTVTNKAVNLSVLGADADTGESSLVYTWVLTSGPAAVTYSANGTNAAKNTTATFTTTGTYAFTVTIKDPSNLTITSSVTVTVVRTATSLKVTPATASVKVKATAQFTAKTYDQWGVAMASQPTFAWSVTGGGTVSSTGLFTAPSSTTPAGGTSTVKATAGGLSGTATITVLPTAPTAASSFTATKNSNRSVKLSWKDASTNEQGFYIETSTNNSTWTLVSTKATTSASTTGTAYTYTTGVYAAGKRYFRIRAYNAGGSTSTASVALTL